MKIDHSRTFTADLYSVKNYREETLKAKNVVMVKFGDKYVPIWDTATAAEYMKLTYSIKGNVYNAKFLTEKLPCEEKEGKIIKNIKPLFIHAGHISLAELMGIQKEHADKDDTYSGFEFEM